ncbi:MAG TPA: hypothetical protein VL443_24190 [Cyclobacteriaceae bacterium]|jgi:hypothetical protein|nr:hypothetical protein [Cyclobacteriaceae bacterium]
MDNYINRNAFYKDLIRLHGKRWTYVKVCAALDGKSDVIDASEKKQLLTLLDEHLKKIRDNIKNIQTKQN